MATTGPISETELQLYHVLQRANLLQYYDTFISQGGDDVRQLCEAGEEEFLEIMALVGMASKPLHVRRLQKALQEWVQNPDLFKQPLNMNTALPTPAPPQGSIMASIQRVLQYSTHAHSTPTAAASQVIHPISATPQEGAGFSPPSQAWVQQQVQPSPRPPLTTTPKPATSSTVSLQYPTMEKTCDESKTPPPPSSLSPTFPAASFQLKEVSPGSSFSSYIATIPNIQTGTGSASNATYSSGGSPSPESPQVNPALSETQMLAIKKSAEKIASEMPQYEPRPLNLKKAWCRGVQEVLSLPDDHPERMDLMRRYGAIYGRFDSKRKPVKPMSMHELCVNEAAAQLCYHCPSLLTRRNDLFPLARDVVRESGYQYSKGHSRGQPVDIPLVRKRKLDEGSLDPYIAQRYPELTSNIEKQEEQLSSLGKEITLVEDQQRALQIQLDEAEWKNDLETTKSLEPKLTILQTRLKKLLIDQSVLREVLATMKSVRNPKLEYEYAKSPGSGDDNMHELQSEDSCTSTAGGDHNPVNIPTTKESIVFGEALLIAQRYGMSDLAAEIKGLHTKNPDAQSSEETESTKSKELTHPMSNDSGIDSEGVTVKCKSAPGERNEEEEEEEWDEQEEWNREVANDMQELSGSETKLKNETT